ncbi:aminotransferase class I/II-fold pyridoxal phosphate-dependent enzyme [Pantoea sp. R13S299]|uniref:aminotransferase class I/II-fold pyridoxal phosphate-dependent enzyme n=1 Tax=Pantoea sp. R13S299 TaxID=3402751 RepID=UPI003AED7825
MVKFAASELVAGLEENLFSILEKQAARLDQSTLPLIDLSSGSPRQPTPPAVIASLQAAAAQPENHEYPSFWGKPALRRAIADFYQRHYGVTLDPETEVALFQGAHIGVTGFPRALLNPGQVLISTDPCYPLYRSAARQAGADFYGIPLEAHNEFLPDFSRVPDEIAARAGLLLLNYPHNPTGALATPALFADALAFARQHHIPLINDFAYATLGCESGEQPVSLLAQPDGKEWGVEIYTLSKSAVMAGWRVGFAVGNASLIAAFKKLHTHSYSTVFGAVQDAAITALSLPAEQFASLAERYHQRRRLVLARLAAMHWPVRTRQGTFFLWLTAPPGFTGKQFAALLMEACHLLVAPGHGFGAAGENYIRISLTVGTEQLLQALDRIEELNLLPSRTSS